MAAQSYENHRHNPKLTSISFLFLVLAAIAFGLRWFEIGGRVAFAAGLAALMASNLVLLAISRSYTTKLQDRIIRLEMRLRCGSLLSTAQQSALAKISMRQLVALRFASDAELPALLDRADRENLTDDQIKRAIKNWVPDFDRT
jgi:uncharacterized protein DUF6526